MHVYDYVWLFITSWWYRDLAILLFPGKKLHQQMLRICHIQFMNFFSESYDIYFSLQLPWIFVGKILHFVEHASCNDVKLPETVLIQFVSPDDEHDVL